MDTQYWNAQSVSWNHQAISAAHKNEKFNAYDHVAGWVYRFNAFVFRLLTKYLER